METKEFMSEKYLNQLELKELQAASVELGHPPAQVYGRLLTTYLLQNKLVEAKLLWKRIPAETKENNPELTKVWNIGKKLFTRELFAIYSMITGEKWPDYLAEMMIHLRDITTERVIKMISVVYTCIHISDISSALNLNQEQTEAKINQLGWRYTADDGFVFPVNLTQEEHSEQNFDLAIANLNKYVAFLESN